MRNLLLLLILCISLGSQAQVAPNDYKEEVDIDITLEKGELQYSIFIKDTLLIKSGVKLTGTFDTAYKNALSEVAYRLYINLQFMGLDYNTLNINLLNSSAMRVNRGENVINGYILETLIGGNIIIISKSNITDRRHMTLVGWLNAGFYQHYIYTIN